MQHLNPNAISAKVGTTVTTAITVMACTRFSVDHPAKILGDAAAASKDDASAAGQLKGQGREASSFLAEGALAKQALELTPPPPSKKNWPHPGNRRGDSE